MSQENVNLARSSGKGGSSRSYRLKRNEKAAEGVRRIARGRVDHALDQLRQQPDGEDAAVHTARKDLKKLRSLLRLVRSELDEATYRAESARYRDAGRLLCDTRDAEVKLQTLNVLRRRFEGLTGVGNYAAALDRERMASSHSELADAAHAIEEGGDAIDDWKLRSGSWAPVGDGSVGAYERGRTALAQVRNGGGGDEAVHEWRKHSKDLWYHLQILESPRPRSSDRSPTRRTTSLTSSATTMTSPCSRPTPEVAAKTSPMAVLTH